MRATITATTFACMLALSMSPGAGAATISKYANHNPAGACMLSIPTTDTGVRPKATGFRNEGTTSNFVICNFDIVTDDAHAGFLSIHIYLASIDGAAHGVSCTAMDRDVTSLVGDYSTKSLSVPAGGLAGTGFSPSDFPDTALAGWNASITCNLPPGVSIATLYGYYNDNVGN